MKSYVSPACESEQRITASSNARHSSASAFSNVIHDSPRQAAQRQRMAAAFGSAVQRQEVMEDELQMQADPTVAQRQEEEELQLQAVPEEELLQGRFATVQLQAMEEEEPLQGKFPLSAAQAQRREMEHQGGQENNTGMPDQLKANMEAMSGFDLSEVREHRNSDKPAQLSALAYAQGNEIHLWPGQERHLPHEAWHVVQQRPGRVRATMQMQGAGLKDDVGLEREADERGERAVSEKSEVSPSGVLQAVWKRVGGTDDYFWEEANYFSSSVPPRSSCPGNEVPNPSLTSFDDRAGEPPRKGGGGFLAPGGTDQIAVIDGISRLQKGKEFVPNDATATSSYFHGKVQIHHNSSDLASQGPGAMFPAPRDINPLPNSPHREIGWMQDTQHQFVPRRSELAIMGESARTAVANSGLDPRLGMAHGHIQPDHAMPEDREDRNNRHPVTEASNMHHSAVEAGITSHIKKYGTTPVGRRLSGEVSAGSGLHAEMEMIVGHLTGDGLNTSSTVAPLFSEEPGRHGDAKAIARYLELQLVRKLTRSVGFGSELGEDSDSREGSADLDLEQETPHAPLETLGSGGSLSTPQLDISAVPWTDGSSSSSDELNAQPGDKRKANDFDEDHQQGRQKQQKKRGSAC